MRSDFCSYLTECMYCRLLCALFCACLKISCSCFVNVSARNVPGERKAANEQLLLLAQIA